MPPASEWVRHGTCDPRRCGGWCCRFVGQSTQVVENPRGLQIDPAYLRARGYTVEHVEGVAVRATLRVEAFAPCPLHDPLMLQCTRYDARPQTCRDFPVRPEQVEGVECSYWWTRTVDDVTERRGGL